MPVVSTEVAAPTLSGVTPDKGKLRKIIWLAMAKTIQAVDQYIKDPSRSPVPVYKPENYPEVKAGSKAWRPQTNQLRLSGVVRQVDDGLSLEVSWGTPYAQYLIEGGRAGRIHAREPGTTLAWPGVVRRVAVLYFMNYLRAEAFKNNIEITNFRMGS